MAALESALDECECTDDYGPCERHCVVLAQREGAAVRTADELCLVFLDDAEGIAPGVVGDSEREVWSEALHALAEASSSSWIDDADLADALHDVVHAVESRLDAWVIWDDGYRIVRPTPDCPLLSS